MRVLVDLGYRYARKYPNKFTGQLFECHCSCQHAGAAYSTGICTQQFTCMFFICVCIYTHTLYVQHHACSHIIPPRLNTAGKSTWVVPSLWNTFEQSQLYSCPSGQGAGCLANWKEPCWALPGSKSSQEGFSGQSRCCRSAWALVMFDHKGQTDLSFQAFSLSRIPD